MENYEQIYGYRIKIQDDQLNVEGIIALIQDLYQQTLLRPRYLLMDEGDIAVVAKQYFPNIPSMIVGVHLVPFPLEHGTVIAGFFGD